ncbi:hypothetical protein SH449x_004887 [Pirellulaceae bacterium SH449]
MTGRHDWYRKETWTAFDRDDFETRLARARKSSRSQYLVIQAERDYPNSRTNVHLEFAEYVLRCHQDNLFHEALLTIDEMHLPGVQFPLHDYLHHAFKAVLLRSLNMDGARQHAELARVAAARIHSGFWKHPTLCLVDEEPDWLRHELDRIIVG